VEAVGAVVVAVMEGAMVSTEQALAAGDRGAAVAVAGEGFGAADEAVAAVIGWASEATVVAAAAQVRGSLRAPEAAGWQLAWAAAVAAAGRWG